MRRVIVRAKGRTRTVACRRVVVAGGAAARSRLVAVALLDRDVGLRHEQTCGIVGPLQQTASGAVHEAAFDLVPLDDGKRRV